MVFLYRVSRLGDARKFSFTLLGDGPYVSYKIHHYLHCSIYNTLGGYANFYGGMRRFNLSFLWVFLDVGNGVCFRKVNLVDTVLVNEDAVKVKLDCET